MTEQEICAELNINAGELMRYARRNGGQVPVGLMLQARAKREHREADRIRKNARHARSWRVTT
jgi:hypothetical protein